MGLREFETLFVNKHQFTFPSGREGIDGVVLNVYAHSGSGDVVA